MSDETAPLLDISEAPRPGGGEAAWVDGAGRARLRAALFTPPGRLRGSVVLSGGRTEPIEKYYETIQDFMARGFVVLAHDWRGQGLSARELPDRLKGHARGYKAFLEDFRRLLDSYDARLPKPWFAVGHSMGGCLTLLALALGERRFAGAVLSAPMLGLNLGKVTPTAARALARFNITLGRAGGYTLGDPGKPFDDTFEGNILTHDRARFSRYRAQVAANPDLALGAPTWGWLDFALRATDTLSQPVRLRSVTIPVEIVSAAEDSLVDNAAQAAAVRNLPQGRLITVAGAFHEILMETDDMRNIFLRVFDALTGKAPSKPGEAPAPAEQPAVAETPIAPPPEPRPVTAAKVVAPKAAKPAPRQTAAAKPKAVAKATPKPQAPAMPKAASAPAAAKVAPKAAAAPKVSAPKAAPAKAVAAKARAAKPAKAKVAVKPAKAGPRAHAKKAAARKTPTRKA